MSTSPRVSVVLPCRNERSPIEACLRSVLAQEPPPGGFEVLVAEGNSDDGTADVLAELARRHPQVRVIPNPERIVSTGLNRAIRAARGEIIARMDAHSEYAPSYLRECVALLDETGADNVGGPWVARGDGYLSRAIAAAFQSPFAVGGARGHDAAHEGPVDTVYLGCWPRVTFERVGYFDEELVRNQDDEHNLRLTRAGGKVWQSPRIRSWYRPRKSLGALFVQYMQYGYWKVRVIQKHRIPASIRHVVPGAFVLTLLSLMMLAPFMLWAVYGLTGVLALYLACVLMASLLTSLRAGPALAPVLPLVFACYHVGYGCGFLRGCLDFLVLRKGPAKAFKQLTRPCEGHPGTVRTD
jgi:glycosyltransferase involved in cell wall biosynthesis